MPAAYHAVRAEELLLKADRALNEGDDMRLAAVYLAAAHVHAALAAIPPATPVVKVSEEQVPQTPGLLAVEDVAEQLGVPVKTVYTWRTRGTGPRGIRVGKHVRYRQSEIDFWLDSQADGA